MNIEPADRNIRKQEIQFGGGDRAFVIQPPADADAVAILRAMDIAQPGGLVVIASAAETLDEQPIPRLGQLFSRGIARAAADSQAVIIDGGRAAGVMQLMGQGVADRGHRSPLIGVASAGLVTYDGQASNGSGYVGKPLDPNHSHFVLIEGDQPGRETETMVALVEALTIGALEPAQSQAIPVVMVVVNGAAIAKEEVLQATRHGWSILAIEGSGGLADEIARLWKSKPDVINDADMAEIIAEGNIALFPLDGAIVGLERLIRRYLEVGSAGDQATLLNAWESFAIYDLNAVRQRDIFDRLQKLILALGVVGTLLVVSKAQLDLLNLSNPSSIGAGLLHWVIVAIPITIAGLIAASNRSGAGSKQILLRAGAEAIKREIFRYRMRAEIYSSQKTKEVSREVKLASKIKSITGPLMQTEVNTSALKSYDGPIPPKFYGLAENDDGLSDLSPEQYHSLRLNDQIFYYRSRAVSLDKRIRTLQVLTYVLGGLGTFLAAVEQELWIAVTTAIVTAIASFMEYKQLENLLMRYNQATTDLENVRAWWIALTPTAQSSQKNIDSLVHYTESILKTEIVGWVREMQDVLAELASEQEKEAQDLSFDG